MLLGRQRLSGPDQLGPDGQAALGSERLAAGASVRSRPSIAADSSIAPPYPATRLGTNGNPIRRLENPLRERRPPRPQAPAAADFHRALAGSG